MKKRVWMIVMIILVIMFIPRNNSHRVKNHQGQRAPHRKVPASSDDFEFPFPGMWLLIHIIPDVKLRRQPVINSLFLASGTRYNRYAPAQNSHGSIRFI